MKSSGASSSKAATESSDKNTTCELPDGSVVTVGSERFRWCDVDIRNYPSANVVLAGGIIIFPGIGERMTKALTVLIHSTLKINVVARPSANTQCRSVGLSFPRRAPSSRC
ncbi:unnamed protein product [Prorocentrum cordatum]|uniref:Uncharacterized protein n=1 Tax=Prorocentrum cordatum TaxID=2364126 RepID=A0ABN9VUJ9_9DINO|nr:unnamed protein product [Polarella glacialis]